MVTVQEYKAKRTTHPTLMKIMNGSDELLRAESLATRNPRYVMPTSRFDATYKQEANSKLEAKAQIPIVGEDYKTDYLTEDLYSMHKTRVKPLASETLTIPQDDSYARLHLTLAHMDKNDGKITPHEYNAEHMLVTDLVQRYANNGLPLKTLNNAEDFAEAIAGVKKQKELDWNAKMLEARFDLGEKRGPLSFYFDEKPLKEFYSIIFDKNEINQLTDIFRRYDTDYLSKNKPRTLEDFCSFERNSTRSELLDRYRVAINSLLQEKNQYPLYKH